ncbi:MAG: pyridoxal-phosphate dependent enzyme [Legionellaceae bacterium]|nr:pyridoxal-phosphate dependent enzyme [Legionellaceae bacterium]
MNSQKKNNILRTPLIPFYSFNYELDASIYLKAENLQLFGSYKVRGIDAFFKNTSEQALCGGVSAASAGNMGQSLAFMAEIKGIPCTIYVPDTAPAIKKERIKKLGANLIELPFKELWQFIVEPMLSSKNSLFIHPVFTESLLSGYENIAVEIVEDLPAMDAIVIPLGIGGLAIAISRTIKRLKPQVAIFTCEPETAAPFKAALKNGSPIKIEPKVSFVDAIGTPEILPYVFEQLAPIVVDSEVVPLIDIEKALEMLLLNNKLLCEGAAACSLAAAINISKKTSYQNIACILTGGNLSTDYVTVKVK